jgi:predicted dehydrogenase
LIRGEIAAGTIGAIQLIRSSIAFGPETLVGWRSHPDQAGAAALYNLGIHALDTVLHLIDVPVVEVAAMTEPEGALLDRSAVAVLRFANGALGVVEASQTLAEDDVRIEVFGDRGTVRWTGWMAPYRSGDVLIRTAAGERIAISSCPDAYDRSVGAFIAAIQAGGVPDPSPDDVLALVRTTEAIVTSARTGSHVQLAAAGLPTAI